MIDRAVFTGSSRAFGDETVGYSFDFTVTSAARALMGVTGSECARYHTNTAMISLSESFKVHLFHTFMTELGGIGGCSDYGELGRRKESLDSSFHCYEICYKSMSNNWVKLSGFMARISEDV